MSTVRLRFEVALQYPLRSLGAALSLALACVLCSPTELWAAAPTPTPQAPSTQEVIEQFVRQQTAGLSGQVKVNIDSSAASALPSCLAPEPFLPSGARLWGRVSIGVRCHANPPWTRYVSSYVAVQGVYYVAARTINAGQALTPADGQAREGDLTTLPGAVIVQADQLTGVVASSRIAAGAPLRRESLRSVAIVQQGQTVKVLTRGAGFVVSAEGRAMGNAAAGHVIQVKMQGGPLLNGIVGADGVVERPP